MRCDHPSCRLVCLGALLGVLLGPAYSQTIVFQGQLLDAEKGEIFEQLHVVMTYQKVGDWEVATSAQGFQQTDNRGFFTFVLPEDEFRDIDRFTFFISESDWKIVTPEEGRCIPLAFASPGKLRVQTLKCKRTEQSRLEEEVKALKAFSNKLVQTIAALQQRSDNDSGRLTYLKDSLESLIANQAALVDTIKISTKREIFTGLDTYVDHLKNLHQVIKPAYIRDAFIFPGAQQHLQNLIAAYNDARASLAQSQTDHIARVGELWGDKQREMLAEVYAQALTTINRDILVEKFNKQVIESLDAVAKQKKSRLVARPRAVKYTKAINQELEKELAKLVDDVEDVQRELLYTPSH